MPKFNPFDKFLGPEDHLHIQVVQYLQLQYPDVFFIHTPNEGKRTKFEQYKFKILGGTPGVPDIMIYKFRYDVKIEQGVMPGTTDDIPNFLLSHYDINVGLAIELKIKPNKPTPAQLECLHQLEKAGWKTHVIYDFDDAKEIIDIYLSN